MYLRLSSENIAAACTDTALFLKENKIDPKEIIRQQISLEETLIRYQAEFGSEAMFELELGKRFGRVKIRITVEGPMLDPFASNESRGHVDDVMRKSLLHMGQLPIWQYNQGRNIIQLTLNRKKAPEWVKLFVSIAAAVICGILIRLMPDAARITLQQSIIAPLLDTFLGFLNAIAGPMIFLSTSILMGTCLGKKAIKQQNLLKLLLMPVLTI